MQVIGAKNSGLRTTKGLSSSDIIALGYTRLKEHLVPYLVNVDACPRVMSGSPE